VTESVDFKHPPLNEVVFSIQFDRDVIDEVGALAAFWPEIKNDYPGLEKQLPMPPAREDFETAHQDPQVQFEMLSAPPTQRYWFLSEDKTKIVQVQADRLMFNWRQVNGDEVYPRYATLLPEFVQLADVFLKSLGDAQRQAATVAWCELTYVNPIAAAGSGEGTHGQLAHILNYLEKDPEREVLPPVEDTQIQQRFRIKNGSGDSIGRLYVTAVPGFNRSDLSPVYVLTLLARGRPEAGEFPQSAVDFIDKAHHLIVNGFREVTTPEMHALWNEDIQNG
jgi:uncharacterized protein (TIGR04255 family)